MRQLCSQHYTDPENSSLAPGRLAQLSQSSTLIDRCVASARTANMWFTYAASLCVFSATKLLIARKLSISSLSSCPCSVLECLRMEEELNPISILGLRATTAVVT